MNNIINLIIIILFASFLETNYKEDKMVCELKAIESQEEDYLISPDRVGLISKGMTVSDLIKIIPEGQIQKKIGYGEFPDDTYDDYEIYDSLGNHTLTITPKTQNDSTSEINRILIVSSYYQTKEGVGLNSSYSELLKSCSIDDYEPDIDHIVLTVDSLNAWFSIKKSELEANWWDKEKKEVDNTKIPSKAKFDSVSIWWD